jgi:hypothetical protein
MNKEHIYDVWAPADGRWSPWVKPVLFACMPGSPPPRSLPTLVDETLSWVPPVERKVAFVVDLPYEAGVIMGLKLAQRGYRPVPLYNALPKPTEADMNNLEWDDDDPLSVVDVEPIIWALWHGTGILSELSLLPDAPPAFLLDANRRTGWGKPSPGRFDNRSVSFTTDFPSALFLRTQGISRVILVSGVHGQPQPDLAHTLRRWQDGGISIELKCIESTGQPVPLTIERPLWFGEIWYRLLVAFGLKRNALGGYGGIIGNGSGG